MDDDHLTLVKPRNRQHDVYAGVLRFIRKALASVAAPGATGPPHAKRSCAVAPIPADRYRPDMNPTTKRFRVALSFPKGQRAYVEKVAKALAEHFDEELVLYDRSTRRSLRGSGRG